MLAAPAHRGCDPRIMGRSNAHPVRLCESRRCHRRGGHQKPFAFLIHLDASEKVRGRLGLTRRDRCRVRVHHRTAETSQLGRRRLSAQASPPRGGCFLQSGAHSLAGSPLRGAAVIRAHLPLKVRRPVQFRWSEMGDLKKRRTSLMAPTKMVLHLRRFISFSRRTKAHSAAPRKSRMQ
jgi:hypothetical protein